MLYVAVATNIISAADNDDSLWHTADSDEMENDDGTYIFKEEWWPAWDYPFATLPRTTDIPIVAGDPKYVRSIYKRRRKAPKKRNDSTH